MFRGESSEQERSEDGASARLISPSVHKPGFLASLDTHGWTTPISPPVYPSSHRVKKSRRRTPKFRSSTRDFRPSKSFLSLQGRRLVRAT